MRELSVSWTAVARLRRVLRALRDFLQLEAASGGVLLCALLLACGWANSPFAGGYDAVFTAPVRVQIGPVGLSVTLRSLVNDGLMTLFFFVVGMEIKRELLVGELRRWSRAILPAVAALGGMVVPALVYLAFNAGSEAQHGWAIPIATDIAFSLGCLTMVKRRVVPGLVVFLTALAIADDIGGIAAVALFYGKGVHLRWLIAAFAVLGLLVYFDRRPVTSLAAFLFAGALLWYVLERTGVHPTLAGVALGLAVPGSLREESAPSKAPSGSPPKARVAPLEAFLPLMHPYAAFGVMPLFALGNAGISLAGLHLGNVLSPVSLGCAMGLFLGKQAGIFLFAWSATKMGLAPIPGHASARMLHAVSTVAGIGFTVALFIAGIAFEHQTSLFEEARLGILVGSGASAIAGVLLLRIAR